MPDRPPISAAASRPHRRRAFRAFLAGLLLGASAVGIGWFVDRFLTLSYEIAVLTDRTRESQAVAFRLDGERLFERRRFAAGPDGTVVVLHHPVRRLNRAPVDLEFAQDGRRASVKLEGGGYRLHCTAVARLTAGTVRFLDDPGSDDTPCIRAPLPSGYD